MKAIEKKTKSGKKVFVCRFDDGETPFDADSEGMCINCGEFASGVEPDARKYECECCGEPGVYVIEELVLMGYAS